LATIRASTESSRTAWAAASDGLRSVRLGGVTGATSRSDPVAASAAGAWVDTGCTVATTGVGAGSGFSTGSGCTIAVDAPLLDGVGLVGVDCVAGSGWMTGRGGVFAASATGCGASAARVGATTGVGAAATLGKGWTVRIGEAAATTRDAEEGSAVGAAAAI
jgi:hypothetical protein